jgi:hypothetical protein
MNPTEAVLSPPVYSEEAVPALLSAYGPADPPSRVLLSEEKSCGRCMPIGGLVII